VSLIAHALVVGLLYVGVPAQKIYTPIEISFGPLTAPASSGPVASAAKPLPLPRSKVALPAPAKPVVAPIVEQKVADAVTTAAAAVAPSTESAVGASGGGGGAASGSGLGGSGSMDPRALYMGRLSRLIQSKVEYPRSARMLNREGNVVVEVKIARDGRILSSSIKKKSDFEAFNKNALETLKRVGRFEAVPAELAGDELTILLPVEYNLRHL